MSKTIVGVLLAFLAYFLLALGFVFQKKGIKIFSNEKKASDYIFWISGLILININPILNFFALKFVPSFIVNAISALTIVFTLILSFIFLKEKLFKSDWFYIIDITLAIFLITFVTKDFIQNSFIPGSAIFFAFLPIGIFIFVLIFGHLMSKGKLFSQGSMPAFVNSMIKVIIPASTSGAMAGFMVVAMKLLQIDKGANFSILYLSSLYLYLFLLNGLISFIAIQIAYKNGSMIMIAPLQYGLTVVYPIIASLFIFNENKNIRDILTIIFLTIAIFLFIREMLKKHKN